MYVSLVTSSSCSSSEEVQSPNCDSDLLPSPPFHQTKIQRLPSLEESTTSTTSTSSTSELESNPFTSTEPRITGALAQYLDIAHIGIIEEASDTEMYWTNSVVRLWYVPFEEFYHKVHNSQIPIEWLNHVNALFLVGRCKFFSKLSQSKQRAYKQLIKEGTQDDSLQQSINLLFQADQKCEFDAKCAQLIVKGQLPVLFYSEVHGSFMDCVRRLENVELGAKGREIVSRKVEGPKVAEASAVWKRWVLEVQGVSENVALSVLGVLPTLKSAFVDAEGKIEALKEKIGERLGSRIALMISSLRGREVMK